MSDEQLPTDQELQDQVRTLLTLGGETRRLEAKVPGRLDDSAFAATVFKACMAMANLRNGGHVVVGIQDTHDELIPVGLDDDALETWKPDDFKDKLATYCDPPIQVDLWRVDIDGKRVVVIRVHEFDDIPVISKKDFGTARKGKSEKPVLKEGALYLRSLKGCTKSTSHYSAHDIRELVELAAEKRVRRFLAMAQRAGIDLAVDGDSQRFEEQVAAFHEWDAFRSLPESHWEIIIRPERFDPHRVSDFSALRRIIQSAHVDLRGLPIPLLISEQLESGQDFIGAKVEFRSHPLTQVWRFHQSGLFVYADPILYDVKNTDGHGGEVLLMGEVICRHREAFALAANLAGQLDDVPALHVDVRLDGIRGRKVLVGDQRWPLWNLELVSHPPISMHRWDRAKAPPIPVDVLVADPHRLAIDAVTELGKRISDHWKRDAIEQIDSSLRAP